jgi:hypothetical protein
MRRLLLTFFVLAAAPAQAAQWDFSGYADLRVVIPPEQDRSWLDGGLGKLRYGKGDSNLQFGGAVGQASVLITPELVATAVGRVESNQATPVDLLEAYVRYRPVSTTKWRWSVKAGAFFAPFSLENTELGWSPYWTLTPSAINSWFGEEFRTIGGEFTLEWRGEAGTLTASGAAFGLNEPAGVMMADRGWTMDDQPTGLFSELRIPDATLLRQHQEVPDTTPLFKQFDSHVGWYAGMSWDDTDQWHVEVYYYDNEADPGAHKDDYFNWHTAFWGTGFEDRFGDDFMVIAQGVSGKTTIAPSPFFRSDTDFDSAFGLLGWEHGMWRLAGRAEIFHTETTNTFGLSEATSENGTALTAAVTMLPADWVKLTGEIVSITSTRGERTIVGLTPEQTETQFQLAARFYWD